LLGAIFVAVAFGALAVACGDDEETAPVTEGTPVPADATPSGATVGVALSEWAVDPDVASVAAGEVTFVVRNDGTIDHELAVIRSDLGPGDLPIDGAKVVEEEAGELIGRTEVFPPGETQSLTFDLEPGDYVLICNIPGHYNAGMFASFSVE
jgi:uncharacterized cupredoxin-like copper-binding protein